MRRFLLCGVLWWVASGLIATAQDPSVPLSSRQEMPSNLGLDELLARWEKRGAIDNLDVKFSQIDRSSGWDDKTYEGRFLRKSPDRWSLELEKVTGQTKVQFERLIRNGERVYQYRFDAKQVLVLPLGNWRDAKDLGSALRSLLVAPALNHLSDLGEDSRLPFLFDMHVGEAKAAFTIKLVKETAAEAIISFTPLTPIGKAMFAHAFMQLDKSQYLPRVVVLIMPGGKESKHYRFTTFTRDVHLEDETFECKSLPGWTTIGTDEPNGS